MVLIVRNKIKHSMSKCSDNPNENCNNCAEVCPALEGERTAYNWIKSDIDCQICEACLEVCPVNAIWTLNKRGVF